MKTCDHCGESFKPYRPTSRYCTSTCRSRAFGKRRTADGRHAAYRAANAEKLAEYRRENKGKWYIDRTCVVCGAVWRTHRRDAKYCSRKCYTDTRRAQPLSRRAQARAKLRAAERGTRSRYMWVQGPCTRCGASFLARSSNTDARYCTTRCSRQDHDDRRRSRKAGATIGTVRRRDVFERDGWMCQLCNLPIDTQAIHPHPASPSIDHIIPLARGGPHSMHNVQAAHFLCNARKRDATSLPSTIAVKA